ncbi:MAG TPA: hypothetical protein VMO47_06540 [Rhodothermales bacterium]|nr:hypothetical protein [Rhodothermales bacterium]
MSISEDRLHLLLPKQLKRAVSDRAQRMGVSVGEYVRGLIRSDLAHAGEGPPPVDFPFGKNPIRTGRTEGSIQHDRPD